MLHTPSSVCSLQIHILERVSVPELNPVGKWFSCQLYELLNKRNEMIHNRRDSSEIESLERNTTSPESVVVTAFVILNKNNNYRFFNHIKPDTPRNEKLQLWNIIFFFFLRKENSDLSSSRNIARYVICASVRTDTKAAAVIRFT